MAALMTIEESRRPGTAAPARPVVPAGRIVAAAAVRFGVAEEELRGAGRRRRVVLARHTAMYLCRTLGGLSLPAIGAELDRDHTTVLHGVRQVQGHLAVDQRWRDRLARLEEQLQAPPRMVVHCPACPLPPFAPAEDRQDAAALAGVHDRLIHRGVPTAVVGPSSGAFLGEAR